MRTSIVALVIVGGIGGFAVGLKVARSEPSAPLVSPAKGTAARVAAPVTAPVTARLVVPRALTAITVDGEPDDAAWTAPEMLRTPAFSVRPYTDARVAVRDGTLYFLLYAADEDLHAANASHDGPLWVSDSMRVILTSAADGPEYVVEVSPAGTLTDYTRAKSGAVDTSWESGAKVGIDLDGTVDDSADNDEEWVAEVSIPLASLGVTGKDLGLRIERTDVSRTSGSRSLAAWTPPGGRVSLAP